MMVAKAQIKLVKDKEAGSKANSGQKSKTVVISGDSSPHRERQHPWGHREGATSGQRSRSTKGRHSPSISSQSRGNRSTSLDRRLDDIKCKYEEIMGTRLGEKYLLDISATPLTQRVRDVPLPRRFHMPQLRMYNGTTNPFDHVHSFITIIDRLAVEAEILCRAFATTLDGSVREWYNRLPRNSIHI